MPRPFLTAEWRHLVMLNFDIAPEVLAPLVPAGCELDTWQGRHLVSVVGFWFLNTRVLGIGIPCHRNFEEINLRFYVRRRVNEELRRGVVFIKEVVARRAIVAVARCVYHENYVCCPTASTIALPTNQRHGTIAYRWKGPAGWNEIAADIAGEAAPLAAGSEEEFIAEHYWGYTRMHDGRTAEYEVKHPSWRVRRATASRLTGDMAAFYGSEFGPALAGPPASAFVAEGSEIAVMGARRNDE